MKYMGGPQEWEEILSLINIALMSRCPNELLGHSLHYTIRNFCFMRANTFGRERKKGGKLFCEG